VTVVGTQPAGRKLRETWSELVDDLAGRYVDARAHASMHQALDATVIPAVDAPSSAQDATSDLLVRARAEARARFEALLADPDNPQLLLASVEARSAAEQVELDSRPPWLTATLGERPVDPKLAQEWDRLGRSMIGLRDANGITDEIDNGYSRAGVPLRQSIARFRLNVGLDMRQPGADIDRGYGIGD